MNELKDYSILDIEAIDDERFKKEKAPGKWVQESGVYLKEDVDTVIADLQKTNVMLADNIVKLNRELESLKASHYAEMVDAGMEIRRLKRALWVTRTAMAKSEKDRWNAHTDCGNRRNRKDPAYVKTGKLLEASEWRRLWADNERKCRAKAERYGEGK